MTSPVTGNDIHCHISLSVSGIKTPAHHASPFISIIRTLSLSGMKFELVHALSEESATIGKARNGNRDK
jgi:hypothetical protein